MNSAKTLVAIGISTSHSLAAHAQANNLVATNAVVKYPWKSSVTAGLTLTRGNSDSLLATIKVLTDRKTPVNEYSFDADGGYGSANGVANSEIIHGYGQWNHLFSERWYGYLRAEGLHDGIAEVKYRGTFTAGAGYYFIKQANTTLAGEVGPGFVTERVGETDDNYGTLRIAERGEHKFGANAARIYESVEFLPDLGNTSDYLVNSEVGAESALYKNVSLSICLDDYFNSKPALGRQRNDLRLVSGITYNF